MQLLLHLLRRLTLQQTLLHASHWLMQQAMPLHRPLPQLMLLPRCVSHLSLMRPRMRLPQAKAVELPQPLQAPSQASKAAVAQGRPQPLPDVLRSRWLWLLLKQQQQQQQPLLLELVRTRAVQPYWDSALAPAALSTGLLVSGLPRQAAWASAAPQPVIPQWLQRASGKARRALPLLPERGQHMLLLQPCERQLLQHGPLHEAARCPSRKTCHLALLHDQPSFDSGRWTLDAGGALTRMAADVAQVPGPEIFTSKWLCGLANGKGARKQEIPQQQRARKPCNG